MVAAACAGEPRVPRCAAPPRTCCASSRVGASTTAYGPSASTSGLPSMGGWPCGHAKEGAGVRGEQGAGQPAPAVMCPSMGSTGRDTDMLPDSIKPEASRPGRLAPTMMYISMGSTKAAVLPEPVSAGAGRRAGG